MELELGCELTIVGGSNTAENLVTCRRLHCNVHGYLRLHDDGHISCYALYWIWSTKDPTDGTEVKV